MRSANWTSAARAALATVPVTLLLSGCVTTQQIAARARLVDARIRASQEPLRITQRNPDTEVVGLSLIRGAAGTAVVAQVRNTSTRPLTDLPIAVGVINGHGHKRYLNRGANLDYLESHIASIRAGAVVSWVFTNTHPLAPGSRPFVEVGVTQLGEPTPAGLLRIAVTGPAGTSTTRSRSLTVVVTNGSAVPQDGFPVYAVAVGAGKVVAAGRLSLTHLCADCRTEVRLRLLGRTGWSAIRLSAEPTIFQ